MTRACLLAKKQELWPCAASSSQLLARTGGQKYGQRWSYALELKYWTTKIRESKYMADPGDMEASWRRLDMRVFKEVLNSWLLFLYMPNVDKSFFLFHTKMT